jgi:hypothetical protein
LGAVAAGVACFVAALKPAWVALFKMSDEIYVMLQRVFFHASVPALGLGLILVGLAVCLTERKRWLSVALLLIAPIATFMIGLALLQ